MNDNGIHFITNSSKYERHELDNGEHILDTIILVHVTLNSMLILL
jgi:hypothetical protein